MSADSIFQKMGEIMKTDENLDGEEGVFQFKIGNGSNWTVDLAKKSVEKGVDINAGATFTMTDEVFTNLMTGKLDPMAAFMNQSLQFDGDMGLAMKLQTLTGSLQDHMSKL